MVLSINESTDQPINIHFNPVNPSQSFPSAVIFEIMPVTVSIINQSPYPLPQYATVGASGVDVRSHIPAPLSLAPLQRVLVPTGLFVEIPEGYEIQMRPRSSLAVKQGITCLNSPGTVDSDYRGELKVLLINLSAEVQIIEPGDRIAQMVLQKVETIAWQEAASLTQTERNKGGFGSTGKS
jgi:dUTP pyrophosphatase